MTAPETFTVSSKRPLTTGRRPDRTGVCAIVLKNPLLGRPQLAVGAAVSEVKSRCAASCGEDWRWKGDELRQFPQILGGGCQEELVFRSVRSAQAQLIEPEDALQVSEEHLTFFRSRRETT